MDLERLRRRVADGDLDAARSLSTEAERRGDVQLAIEALAALGDRAGLLELLDRVWESDDALAEVIGRTLGLVLDAETRAAIAGLYRSVRGRARARIMSRVRVLALLERARRQADGWLFEVAERPTLHHQRAMVALVVPGTAGGRITLGLGWCRHRDPLSTPGRHPYDPDNSSWAEELGAWAHADREALLAAWALGRDGRVVVATCEPRVRDEDASRPWREALELLLAREPSVEVWHDLVDLLAAWPGGVDAELGATICARLDARWPDVLRQRATRRRNWYPTPPSVPTDWPIARGLHVSGADEPTDIAALEGLERTRMLHLRMLLRVSQPIEEARPFIQLIRDQRLHGVRALAVYLRDGGLPHLAECTDWLARLRSLTIAVLGMGPSPEDVAPIAALLARTPALRQLDVRADLGAELAAVGALADLHALESLTMVGHEPDVAALASILDACGGGDGLRALCLGGYDAGVLTQVASSAQAPGLQRLALRDMRGLASQGAFAELCERLDPVEHLHLGWRDREQRLAVAGPLVCAPWLARLRTLEISGLPLDEAAVRALVEAAPAARPTRLTLRACKLGNDSLAAVCEAGWLEAVEVLDLADNALTGAGLELMLGSPYAPRALRELDLGGNKLGVTGARALADWPGARSVARLWLGSVGRRGVEALNASPHVRGELGGSSTGYRPSPWRALIA